MAGFLPREAAVFTASLCPAAHWVTLASWLHITDAHCSLSVALSPSIPTGTACMQHVHVSGQSGCSLSPLLSPGHRELQAFCLPVSVQPLRTQGNRIPFVATVRQPPAARAVSARHKAHPQSLFQPQSPCWESKGFKSLTSDIQKGRSFQKMDAHSLPDPRANLQC